jgi:hypothetical protein
MEVSNMNNYESTEKELQAQGWIKLNTEPEFLFRDPNWNKLGMLVDGQVWIYGGRLSEGDILEWVDGQWWIAPPAEIMSERDFAFNWERYCDPWELGGRAWGIIRQNLEQAAREKGAEQPVAIVFAFEDPCWSDTIDLAGAERIYSYADADEESYAYRLPNGQIVAWSERRSGGWVRCAWSDEEIQERLADELSEADEEDEDEDEGKDE